MKKCSNCGASNTDDAEFCADCGEKIVNLETLKTSSGGRGPIGGFVLGLLSLGAWFIPLVGYPVTICGIIFSARGIRSANKNLMVIGLILSIVGLIATIVNSILGVLLQMGAI